MPDVVSWPRHDAYEAIARARAVLEGGGLVVVPTEATYEIVGSALHPDAVAALVKRAAGQRLAITLAHAIEIFDWLPFFPGLGLRLVKRFWPGPLTIVNGAGLEHGLASRLPASVRTAVAPDRSVALRLPDHVAPRLLGLRGLPLVGLGTTCSRVEEIGDLGGGVLVLDDGPARLGRSPTTVRLCNRTCSIEREEAISRSEIEDRLPCRVVFVCTGNTCRSPIAAGLFGKLLADRLGCAVGDLPSRGFRVQSAGLAAMMGEEASLEAVEVGREMGADLSSHRSQPLTVQMLTEADVLFTMTSGHLRLLGEPRGIVPRLLSPAGEDIMDPIGSSIEVYRACAQQIRVCLEERLPELHEA